MLLRNKLECLVLKNIFSLILSFPKAGSQPLDGWVQVLQETENIGNGQTL